MRSLSPHQQYSLLILLIPALAFQLGGPAWNVFGPPRLPAVATHIFLVEGKADRPGYYLFHAAPTVKEVMKRAGVSRPAKGVQMEDSPPGGSRLLFGGDFLAIDPLPENQRFLAGLGLDINRARPEDLILLPGIGPGRSRSITETRRKLRGFDRIEDLVAVPGIGPSILDRIRAFLVCGDNPPVDATLRP